VSSDWQFLATVITVVFSVFHLALGVWLVSGLRKLHPVDLLAELALPTATILVAARNEIKNAQSLVTSLLAQQYPSEKLRIVVVDDRSGDGTGEAIKQLGQGRIDVLRVEICPARIAPKKNALMLGIRSSDSEIIAVMDADNRPDPMWLWSHASRLQGNVGVSTGVVYHARNPQLSDRFQGIWAAEIFNYAAISAGAIGNGFPLSANGGNLAYRRRAFDQAGAYARNLGIVSGDDDFLVQAITARTPWRVEFSMEAATQVPTQGPLSWRHAWEQRKRWASKCVRFETPQLLLLSTTFASYCWLLLLAIVGITNHACWWMAFFLWGCMWLLGWRQYSTGLDVFGPRVRKSWFPLAMAMQIPLAVGASVLGTFGRFAWKDGAVRGGALDP
jgi:cellulose synthase/poly-beta-1,6-N-acetylglucosamine synthase-like glycosyltransferase